MTTSIKISRLLEDSDYDLRLTLVAGKNGLNRIISSSRIQKPGLALTGCGQRASGLTRNPSRGVPLRFTGATKGYL